MSEKKSTIFEKIILPSKYKIEIEKSSDMWELKYEEYYDVEDQKMLKEALNETKKFFELANFPALIEESHNKFSFTARANFDTIACILAGEFMFVSKIGDVKLRDLLALVGLLGINRKNLHSKEKSLEQ